MSSLSKEEYHSLMPKPKSLEEWSTLICGDFLDTLRYASMSEEGYKRRMVLGKFPVADNSNETRVRNRWPFLDYNQKIIVTPDTHAVIKGV